MTDPDLVRKKLGVIDTSVSQLRELARPEELGNNVVQEHFIQHALQIAIQAVIDVASHIVSDERLGEPRNNQQLLDLLHHRVALPDDLLADLHRMIGFRNVLVHAYDNVDLSVVKAIVETKLDDLLKFGRLVTDYLEQRETQEGRDGEH